MIVDWLKRLSLKWITLWHGVNVVRVTGFIQLAYALAIASRPRVGAAFQLMDHVGLTGNFLAGIMIGCALPLMIWRVHHLMFFFLSFPLVVYTYAACLWALDSAQPLTAVAANGSVLLLLTIVYSQIAWEGRNGRDH